MSEPVKLQQRLSAEFSPVQTREDRASVPEPPSLEPDLDTGPQPEPEGHATARSIVAGVGLLCSALACPVLPWPVLLCPAMACPVRVPGPG